MPHGSLALETTYLAANVGMYNIGKYAPSATIMFADWNSQKGEYLRKAMSANRNVRARLAVSRFLTRSMAAPTPTNYNNVSADLSSYG